MARGKIVYTPIETRAISLPGSAWLSINQAAFNLGTAPFNLDLLFYLAASQPDEEAWLVSKCPGNLVNQVGWRLFYVPRYQCLGFVLNDGQEVFLPFLSPEGSVPGSGWYWAGFNWDRVNDPTFYIAGLSQDAIIGAGEYGAGDIWAGGSGLPAAWPGSLDNDEPLRLGGYNGINNRFNGYIDFVRLDFGRSLPADWWKQEWARVRYGLPRNGDEFLADCLAVWDFNESLLDDSGGGLELTHNGGLPVYVSGWPFAAAPLEVAFQHNFEADFTPGFLALDDVGRSLDGTAQAYAQSNKKQSIRLPFKGINHAQRTALMAAHQSLAEVGLFLDANHRQACRGIIPEPPDFSAMPYFLDGEPLWDGEVTVVSI